MSKPLFLVKIDTDIIVNTIVVDDNWTLETNTLEFPPDTYPLEPARDTCMGIGHKYDKLAKQLIGISEYESDVSVYKHTLKENLDGTKEFKTEKLRDKELINNEIT